MALKKINYQNFKPTTAEGSLPVLATHYNELIDYIEDALPSEGVSETNSISEETSGSGITMNQAIIRKNTATAVNATATLTAAAIKGGLITSTSAAAVTMTMPTGTLLGTALGATRGTIFDFVVDNTAGANTVTLAAGTNCVASAWNVYIDVADSPLDVVSGVTGIATFRVVFSSATACTFCRIS